MIRVGVFIGIGILGGFGIGFTGALVVVTLLTTPESYPYGQIDYIAHSGRH